MMCFFQPIKPIFLYTQTGKRNASAKFCQVLHVAHKQELRKLTMARILSQASGNFNLLILFANIHLHILTAVTIFFPS